MYIGAVENRVSGEGKKAHPPRGLTQVPYSKYARDRDEKRHVISIFRYICRGVWSTQ